MAFSKPAQYPRATQFAEAMMGTILLAQLGFSAFSMLAWTLAAGIPIAIHLLRKRRQSIVKWAAMELLQRVIDQQSKRTRIQELLLLMLRIAALLLFAVALARPFLAPSGSGSTASSSRPNRTLIMLVDTSYSMGYRNADGASRLDRAKQYLSRLIESSITGDACVLLAMEEPTRAIISSPTFDLQASQAELLKLKETACGCNLVQALSMAENIAAECKHSSNFPTEIHTVVVSDLGSDAWQDKGPLTESVGRKASTDVVDALNRLQRISSVHIEPLVDSNPVNHAIVSLNTSTSKPLLGSTFNVDVRVASYGHPAKSLPIQLELDGQVVASQTIDIENNEIAQVRFSAVVNSLGSHIVSAMISNDNLTIDNRYDLVVESETGSRILIVQNQNDSRPKNAWQVALQAASEDLGSTQLQIRTVSDIAWSSQSLDDWDVLILDDVALNSTQLSRLAGFIESGRAAIVNWGAKQSLAQLASQADMHRRVFGFDFQSVSDEGDWMIDPLEYRSPIVAPFAGFPNAGLLTTPIFRYWKIGNKSEDLKVDVALNSGDPWLVRYRKGKGWIASLLSAPEFGQETSNSTVWNAITTWPSFLPLAQQLVQAIADIDNRAYNRLAGQAIGDQFSLISPVNNIRLQRPDGSEIEISSQVASNSSNATWTYANTCQRGIYRVTEPEDARSNFAINIDPVQSDLSSLDPQTLAPFLKPASEFRANPAEQVSSNDDSLARTLLVILLVVLVIESLLAWSLGRQST